MVPNVNPDRLLLYYETILFPLKQCSFALPPSPHSSALYIVPILENFTKWYEIYLMYVDTVFTVLHCLYEYCIWMNDNIMVVIVV